MKKTFIAAILAVAFVGAQVKTAEAHDRFNPIGAVLGGIVAGAVIADAFQPHTVYYSQPAPVYQCAPDYYRTPCQSYYPPPSCEPRVYVQPRPVVVYREPQVSVQFGFGDRYDYREYHHYHDHCW